jgi:prepilin-type N-terminal cleavage/methylation domain-containing protein
MIQLQPPKSTEFGFTIIEVLIGISIFAIGMMAVASMQYYTVRNTTLGNLTSQANMLANQRMEEIKTMSFDNIDALASPVVENNLDDEGHPGGIYNRTTTIDPAPGALGSYARDITVQVQWNAAHGGDRTVEINSLTYERWRP